MTNFVSHAEVRRFCSLSPINASEEIIKRDKRIAELESLVHIFRDFLMDEGYGSFVASVEWELKED